MWATTISAVEVDSRTRQALEFLRARACDPSIGLHQTAAAVRLSTFHLSRSIKSATGIGFARHLRSIRITRAEVLLRTTNLTVKEVAFSVGYANTNALGRNFKAVFAVTPTIYRLRMSGLSSTATVDR